MGLACVFVCGCGLHYCVASAHPFLLPPFLSLSQIGREYAAGRLLTGEVKKILIDVLTPMVAEHQAARATLTEEHVKAFMAVRPLQYARK
jgi:tryptophanyl-tRNA synthetase